MRGVTSLAMWLDRYLLKAHVLFGDEQWLDMFNTARAAVQKQLLFGSLHVEVRLCTAYAGCWVMRQR